MLPTIEAYDVAVIGAGLAGSLVARRLAEAGKNVVILESRDLPGGLNTHSAGLSLLGTTAPYTQLQARVGDATARTMWRLTHENLDLLKHSLPTLGVDYQQCGSQRYINIADKSSYELLKALNYTVTLTEQENKTVLHIQDDISFSPAELIAALLEHPHITLETRAEVQALKENQADSKLLTIWARKRYLWAKSAVLTSGAYAVHLSKRLQDMIHPLPIHTAIVKCPVTNSRPLILNAGQVIVTPQTDTYHITACAETSPQALSLMRTAAQQLQLDGPIIARHSGWVADSKDAYPIVGAFTDEPNIYHLNGLGFWGTSWVWLATERLVNAILTQQNPGELSVNRFC